MTNKKSCKYVDDVLSEGGRRTGIILYKVRAFLSSRLKWPPPPGLGETHSLAGDEVGGPTQTTGQKLSYSV